MLLSGEAGIGKSRLTAALLERIAEPHTRLRYFCSPHHTTARFIRSSAKSNEPLVLRMTTRSSEAQQARCHASAEFDLEPRRRTLCGDAFAAE